MKTTWARFCWWSSSFEVNLLAQEIIMASVFMVVHGTANYLVYIIQNCIGHLIFILYKITWIITILVENFRLNRGSVQVGAAHGLLINLGPSWPYYQSFSLFSLASTFPIYLTLLGPRLPLPDLSVQWVQFRRESISFNILFSHALPLSNKWDWIELNWTGGIPNWDIFQIASGGGVVSVFFLLGLVARTLAGAGAAPGMGRVSDMVTRLS